MKTRLSRETIALRAAKEIPDGGVVNLGGGIPTLCANFVPEGRKVIYHTESGVLGLGPIAYDEKDIDPYLMAANGSPFITPPGMCLLNHSDSFGLIRSGRIDITILGALQVSEKGDLANWTSDPKGEIGGVGGGMDMAFGCKKVIVAMEHLTPKGELKILNKCSYSLTCPDCVNLIVTDVAVIRVIEAGLLLEEIAPGWTKEEVQAITEPKLIISDNLVEINF
jgi:3-oxoacid CoA-transferase B subunit